MPNPPSPRGAELIASASDLALETLPPLARHAPLPRVLYALLMRLGDKFGSTEEPIVTLAGRFRAEGSAFVPRFISGDGSVDSYHDRGINAEILDLRRTRPGTLAASGAS